MPIMFISFLHTLAQQDHQTNSGSHAARWRDWAERRRQRAALRDVAENPHLLDDLGLTREQALREAAKPFWR